MHLHSISIVVIILCWLDSSLSYPFPGTDIFRPFYEKTQINAIQAKLIQTTNPRPVVDTMTEAEKCCNTQQHPIGKAVVGAYEKLSSSLANLVQVPKQAADNIGATITVALNQVGGKVVGLQT